MAMGEDFGDFGDEQFLGFCAEDWRDYAPLDAEENHNRQLERRRLLEEDEVDDAWDRENEADLYDIVSEDYSSDEDYLNCTWEE